MAEPLRYRRPASDDQPVRSRSIPSLVDELGDRLVSFDAVSETSTEILRVARVLADTPGFEAALRARVDELHGLRSPALATVHFVERADDELLVTSRFASGRRLSELLPVDDGWAFALRTIRDVTPTLAALHESGDGVAHGALSTARIILTKDDRLVVIEHMLGSAFTALRLSPSQIREFGIVAPSSDPVRLSPRTDLAQLGFVALSLLLGRQLDASAYPMRIPALLDELVERSSSRTAAIRLRGWIERAMQFGPDAFANAREAESAFTALLDELSAQQAESAGALLAFPSESRIENATEQAPVLTVPETPAVVAAPQEPTVTAIEKPRGRSRAATWIIAALALVALAEGAALAALFYWRPFTEVRIQGPAQPLAPVLQASAVPDQAAVIQQALATTPAAVTPGPSPSPAAAQTAPPRPAVAATGPAEPVAPPAGSQRFGGLTVSSPIELQVFRDGKPVGASTGPIAMPEGRYTLEFANAALGFRMPVGVNITNGQMTTLKIPVPNGRVNINAAPWAEVTVDGAPAGQTPIANLELPIGSHEIVFRHPQLGERRQAIVVTLKEVGRVTVDLRVKSPQ